MGSSQVGNQPVPHFLCYPSTVLMHPVTSVTSVPPVTSDASRHPYWIQRYGWHKRHGAYGEYGLYGCHRSREHTGFIDTLTGCIGICVHVPVIHIPPVAKTHGSQRFWVVPLLYWMRTRGLAKQAERKRELRPHEREPDNAGARTSLSPCLPTSHMTGKALL